MGDETKTSLLTAFLGHSVTGMLLVAFVDGKLAWDEREVLVQAITAIGPHVTAEQALSLLDETAHLLADPRAEGCGLLDDARTLPTEHKVMLLGLCTKVAFADGYLSAEEGQLLRSIADWIDLDESGRIDWRQSVEQALAEARSRNSTFAGFENLF